MKPPPNVYLLPSSKPIFVENDTVPTVNLSSDKNLTFTWRGLTVPTVEALCAELAVRRDAREQANPVEEWDDAFLSYGRPMLVITSMSVDEDDGVGEEVAKTYPWDHTVWSLLEAAEQARGFDGRVFIQQDVVTHVVDEEEDDVQEDGTVWLDGGFRVLCADFIPAELREALDTEE
jgi:hypothetical protein